MSKSVIDHLSQYANYHRDPRNIATHFVGVPMILWAILALLARPAWELGALGSWGPMAVSPAWAVVLGLSAFYVRLDARLGWAMAAVLFAMLALAQWLAGQGTALWLGLALAVFAVGWVIQFVGHYYEGKKPAFVDDLMGLIIGPLFVLAEAVFLLGLRQPLQAAITARSGPVRLRQAAGSAAT